MIRPFGQIGAKFAYWSQVGGLHRGAHAWNLGFVPSVHLIGGRRVCVVPYVHLIGGRRVVFCSFRPPSRRTKCVLFLTSSFSADEDGFYPYVHLTGGRRELGFVPSVHLIGGRTGLCCVPPSSLLEDVKSCFVPYVLLLSR